jgi:hypothetical protein
LKAVTVYGETELAIDPYLVTILAPSPTTSAGIVSTQATETTHADLQMPWKRRSKLRVTS